jgi:hypothetical protein
MHRFFFLILYANHAFLHSPIRQMTFLGTVSLVVLSCAVSMVVMVALLKVPWLLLPAGRPLLDRAYSSLSFFLLDTLLISLYLGIPVMAQSSVSPTGLLMNVTLFTILVSGFFLVYYKSRPHDPSSFYSSWFHSVGAPSLVYDVLLLLVSSIVYLSLKERMSG